MPVGQADYTPFLDVCSASPPRHAPLPRAVATTPHGAIIRRVSALDQSIYIEIRALVTLMLIVSFRRGSGQAVSRD